MCTGEWIHVMPALARDGGSNITVAGDLIELAVLCESSDQLVTSSTDM